MILKTIQFSNMRMENNYKERLHNAFREKNQ